jgi:hypothetical protein
LPIAVGCSLRHKRDIDDQQADTKMVADDTLEKAKERTRHQVERRMLHKQALHDLIRSFVDAYNATATPDAPRLHKGEREDLQKGIREKWAVLRAAKHFKRDERTIREALNSSTRSRSKR